jgi:hypothetical protein
LQYFIDFERYNSHLSRELSNGVFSPDNYKQINGGSVEVPIYEAKVTKDLRLVVGCFSHLFHSTNG